MALLSEWDWTGREVNGVILGDPAREFPGDQETPASGLFIWDGSGLEGIIDEDGDVFIEVDESLVVV